MKCIDPEMKKLISLYQIDLLPEEENIIAEAHLLDCDVCFKEFYRLRPVFELFEEMPARFLEDLQPSETPLTEIIKFLHKKLEQLKNGLMRISSTVVNWWKRPWIKILVPATIVVLLAIFLLPWQPKQYSDLAIIKKSSYQTLQFKGPIELTEIEKLFEDAMKLYEQDNYPDAIKKLNVYLEREPTVAAGHFYLGVCLLLEDQIEQAISHLKLASEFSQQAANKNLLEKCYWYLGNAYLKINNVENASGEFRKVVALKGEFEAAADKQFERIREMNVKREK